MKRNAIVITILIAAASCGPTRLPPDEVIHVQEGLTGKTPWSGLSPNRSSDQFRFAIFSDLNTGERYRVFDRAVESLNALQPEFVICVGDLISGNWKDPKIVHHQWDAFDKRAEALEVPFFRTPGNHDTMGKVMEQVWLERFGAPYYHFVYRNALFLVLNSACPDGIERDKYRLGKKQVEHFKTVLSQNAAVSWTFVFLHHPLWLENYSQDRNDWLELEKSFPRGSYTVFAGHYHTYTKHRRRGADHYVLATTGGESGLDPLPEGGQFDHVTWVTAAPEGPSIVNLKLDGILPDDIATEETVELVRHMRTASRSLLPVLLVDTVSYQGLSTKLILTNAGDRPMQANVRVEKTPGFTATPGSVETTVRPRSTKTIPLSLELATPVPTKNAPSVRLRGQFSYELPDREPLICDIDSTFGIETMKFCPPRTTDVTVDGKLSEWKTFPYTVRTKSNIKRGEVAWSGPADNSFEFAIEAYEGNVVVAVRVTDERLVAASNRDPWDQDGIEIRLDIAANGHNYAGNRQEGKEILMVALSPGATPQDMVFFWKDQMPEGVNAVCLKSSRGFDTELIVPHTYLNEKAGGDWHQFRFNVMVNDFDAAGDPDPGTTLAWQTDWRSPDSRPGSGIFHRVEAR